MGVTSTSERRERRRRSGRFFLLGLIIGMFAGVYLTDRFGNRWDVRPRDASRPDRAGNGEKMADFDQSTPAETVESSIEEVLSMAEAALAAIRRDVDDYTAVLVKQERVGGTLGEPQRMNIKVQTPHRGGRLDESESLRVYLSFQEPEGVAGREVIWAPDLHDGKLVAHEAGLLGMMTVRLDPTGMLAMRGQRYPITDIGLTNLIKKLIERGGRDRDNPDVEVTITRGLRFDDRLCDQIVVRRSSPTSDENDFSRAEVLFDRERQLPLRYVAYGWPESSGGSGDSSDSAANESPADSEGPVLESYTYLQIRTNVGLTESDFDPDNPEYRFR